MYDRTTVHGATLTCVVNSTAGSPTPRLCSVVQWSRHWAPSRTTRVLVLAGARRCALKSCGKKNASSALRLGLIYILFTFESHSPFCFFTVLMLGLKRVLTLIFILFQRQAFFDSPGNILAVQIKNFSCILNLYLKMTH